MTTSLVNGNKTFITLSNTTLPATPPSGIVLYSDSGALKYLNSGGSPISTGGVSFIEITGQNELFLGTGVGNSSADAARNLGVGPGPTLDSITTGDDNTAAGYNAATALTTASSCVAIGSGALAACTVNSSNTVVGMGAAPLLNNATEALGAENTILGRSAAPNLVTGNNNISIGYFSGQTSNNYVGCVAVGNTTALGSASAYCFVIGFGANIANSSITNSGALGANATVSISSAINIGNACKVGINQSSPDSTLTIANVSGVCCLGLAQTGSTPGTPSEGITLYWDGTNLNFKDDGGVVRTISWS
jgi:hypothetical protein